VRLRAFNLDQQLELFRQDEFDDAGFLKLVDSLQPLQLRTVSYEALQQQNGGQDLLLNYVREEMLASNPSDVVIILGRRTEYRQQIPPGQVVERETASPQFFYFEYSSLTGRAKGHYPDVVANLTKRLDGTVYEINSPHDLAHSVQKMLARVSPTVK
jgi:hypothetical protein